MDNELIKIEERNGQQAVNARELHEVLGSKQEFANWIKNRIEKYGFVENQDYEVFDNSVKNLQGGRPTKEYALSIDMAKELAMVENNDKGRQIRQYFITMEKKARQLPGLPQTFSEALMLAAKQQERIEEQQKALNQQTRLISDMTNTITDMQEKVSYVNQILASKDTVVVTSIAQDYGMSAKAFNIQLRNLGIQHKVARQWVLYAKYIQEGYVHSSTFTFKHSDGTDGARQTTEWTQKGRLFLYNELKKHDILPLIERKPMTT